MLKLKELKIIQVLSNVFNVLLTKGKSDPRHTLRTNKSSPQIDKKIGGRAVKKAKGKVSTDTTIFNHPRKDFHAN